MSHKPLVALLATVIICLVFVKPAKADPVTLTLLDPHRAGTVGSKDRHLNGDL